MQCKCRRCINCGKVITKEDWIWVDGDTLCTDCYENLLGEEIEICDICGCAHFSDNDRMIFIQEEEETQLICDECFETGDYYICDDCGNVIDPYIESVTIRNDNVYCEDCASDHTDPNEEYVHEYGYSPRIMFNDGEELYRNPKKGGKIFWATYDSSIQCLQGGCAAEIVTQPTTLKAWQNYSDAFFDALEYNCDTNTSCGLHIHVNKDSVSDETIEKAMLFISKHYEKVTIFADRLMCNICSYAGDNLERYKDFYPCCKSVKEQINLVKKGKDNVRNKYLAINTMHKKYI